MLYQLNLREVTYALSEALDFVGIDDTLHGKRVAFMASEVAKKLGWRQSKQDRAMMIGMLHDCGVSSTDVHKHLVTELDWNDSHLHCERGAKLLQSVPLYHEFSDAILYHHTHWDHFSPAIDEETKIMANLIYLVDRVDALRVQKGSSSRQEKEAIRDTIQKYGGTFFAPHLCNAFLDISSRDSFWYYLEADSLHYYFLHWLEQGSIENIPFDYLKSIANMFASVVDNKSHFTAAHTYGVAVLARYIAEICALSEAQQEIVELAALFHDLGKLRVPDEILNKPSTLDEAETHIMHRHGFDSQMILKQIKGFSQIALIASMHHETLDAQGYPYGLSAENIPIEARILTIADIFQALVQNRPYRESLPLQEVYAILQQLARESKIDGDILAFITPYLQNCYEKAL
jgi:HD-GYP domain-containing protein (c-di-GMP phosphodiesterase class II)